MGTFSEECKILDISGMIEKTGDEMHGVWVNMTSHHMTTVGQPIRMRCLQRCVADEACRAVNYKTIAYNKGVCALVASQPQQYQMVPNVDWNLILFI